MASWWRVNDDTATRCACRWLLLGMQDLIRKLPEDKASRVGNTGGDVFTATYRNHGPHAEDIENLFDPDRVSYRCLWAGKLVTQDEPVGPLWEAELEHHDCLKRIPHGYTCH